MTTNGSGMTYYFTGGTGSGSYTITLTPGARYTTYAKNKETIMLEPAIKHKKSEGSELVVENPSLGLDDLLSGQR